MPTRPVGPCTYPACPALAVARGRCALHPAPPRTHALSFWSRGYGAEWRRNQARAIRDTPWCVVCGHPGSADNPLSGDHIIPLSKGGTHDQDNIQTLCRRCNSHFGSRLKGG